MTSIPFIPCLHFGISSQFGTVLHRVHRRPVHDQTDHAIVDAATWRLSSGFALPLTNFAGLK